MDYFRKLPGFRRSPSGLEWLLLKKLPLIALLGTLIPAAFLALLWWAGIIVNFWQDKLTLMVIGFVVFFWTMIVLAGIGAFIVMVMKGPAYIADPYYSPDFHERDNDENANPFDRPK
ncbi:hypothetical protein MTYP_00280 [Methylophilaceae bacterium]|nr:hypothetical protein MTYP_00280 [Methylophilaceae bacterium]